MTILYVACGVYLAAMTFLGTVIVAIKFEDWHEKKKKLRNLGSTPLDEEQDLMTLASRIQNGETRSKVFESLLSYRRRIIEIIEEEQQNGN